MAYEYLAVGNIADTHGLRGEVRVWSRTDYAELRFTPGSKLWLRRPGENPTLELVVRSARPHKQFWLVSFEGRPTINDVEWMKGQELCIHETQLAPLPTGTYYLHQLIGLRVQTEDGENLGELVQVLMPGANDVYVVRSATRKKDILLPAIPDCILDVNLSSQIMVVHILPGLLDDEKESKLESSEQE